MADQGAAPQMASMGIGCDVSFHDAVFLEEFTGLKYAHGITIRQEY